MPLSTIVIANLKEFVRSRSITLSALPRLKPETEKKLTRAVCDYKRGKNLSHVLLSSKEISDFLKSL